jgi:16S rRNA (adenine1518-N6/adenine1519-N6)-dimethyltransferase
MTNPTSPPPPLQRLGQNFLIDPNIVRKILHEAAILPHETVFEIGPGRGVLTKPLCDLASQVIAVELDKKLATYLSSTCHQSNLDLHAGDALEFNYHSLPQGTVVVANLPYYVSTPLLFQLLEHRSRISRMVVMLQLEVAKRLSAKPGSRDYGSLSVLTQYCADSRVAFKVPASCFRPRPEVASAVVTLTMHPDTQENDAFDQHFMQTVRAAFSHRRKTLVNSFRDSGWSTPIVHDALDKVGINSNRRAETITLKEFIDLTNAFQQHTPDKNPTTGDGKGKVNSESPH